MLPFIYVAQYVNGSTVLVFWVMSVGHCSEEDGDVSKPAKIP